MINYKKKVKEIYPAAFQYFERYSFGDHVILDHRVGYGNVIYGVGYSAHDAWKNAYERIQAKILRQLND